MDLDLANLFSVPPAVRHHKGGLISGIFLVGIVVVAAMIVIPATQRARMAARAAQFT